MLQASGLFWLLLDGHSSYCPDTFRLAAQHQVIVVCFATPHYTSDSATWQGVLWATKGSLEESMTSILDQESWQCDHQIWKFSALFHEAWMQSMGQLPTLLVVSRWQELPILLIVRQYLCPTVMNQDQFGCAEWSWIYHHYASACPAPKCRRQRWMH